MITYRALITASVAATISLGFVFIFPDLGQAQTPSQRGDQGQVHKGTQRTDQGQSRKSVQRATQGKQVRKGAQNKSRTATRVPAQAGANNYDGSWSVSFRGGSGACAGHAMSYAVQIRNGNISYGGGDGSGSGHVNPGGALSFHVVSGDRSANGSGHISGSSGGGSWRGQAGGAPCAGSWVASR
jgi:hypothetical protein